MCFAPFDIDKKDPKVYFAVLAEKLRLFAMKTEVGIYKWKQESKKKRTRPRKKENKEEKKNSTKKTTKKKR